MSAILASCKKKYKLNETRLEWRIQVDFLSNLTNLDTQKVHNDILILIKFNGSPSRYQWCLKVSTPLPNNIDAIPLRFESGQPRILIPITNNMIK